MKPTAFLPLSILFATACPSAPTEDPTEAPPVALTAGAPEVGAAEGVLELPLGTPLAGYTSRCLCLFGIGSPDDRESHFATGFVPSSGVQIRPTIKVVWISNGNEHMVLTKTDSMSSWDGLPQAIAQRLSEETGQDLTGRVTHSGNHNHSSYGTVSGHVGLYLGNDEFLPENHAAFVEQVVAVALDAYADLQPAKMGIGWEKDWDPENQVYSDRRGENNELMVFADEGPEQGGKDPHLQVWRFDALDDTPLAIIMSWGMHPIVMPATESMVSADATFSVEAEVAESFDHEVVAMFLQGSGGDASVRGRDDGYARMETVGILAKDAILDLWEQTPTSAAPLTLDAVTRSFPIGRSDVHVTRDGTVDWYYPDQPDGPVPADDIIYNADGSLSSPLDEWTAEHGAVFCGQGLPLFPTDLLTEAEEYGACVEIDDLLGLLEFAFDVTPTDLELPLPGMEKVQTGVASLGPIPVRAPDGSTAEEDVLLGFFPGESTHFYHHQWRRRAADELGVPHALAFAYSMDHEGYLLLPEDWLMGGYESDISFMGPLAAEYLQEQMLLTAGDVLLDDLRQPDDAQWAPATYPERAFRSLQIDATPQAGQLLSQDDLPDTLWIPPGFAASVDMPAEVPRIAGQVQFAWHGGDPAVDQPDIHLERLDDSGAWQSVTSRSGRPITEDHPDIVHTHTPVPLEPVDAPQEHIWWAAWQAVGHIHDRAGLPSGTYRFRVAGHHHPGGMDTWPWTGVVPYEAITPSFEVRPATLTLERADDGFWVSLDAPEDGYRLVDIDGSSTGSNPVRGPLTITWTLDATTEGATEVVEAPAPSGGRTWLSLEIPKDSVAVTVTDQYGNTGSVGLD